MSDASREPPAPEPGAGECLWRRSSRGSTLALVFGVACAALGIWLHSSDPRHTVPLLVLLGGLSVPVLGVWAVTSSHAVVAMFERGLRAGWLGGRTRFVRWEDVSRVDDELRRWVDQYGLRPYDYSHVVHVHCAGKVYAIHDRFVGAKSFAEAKRVLRARVRPECFHDTATGFDPPSRARLAVGASVLWLAAIAVLVLTLASARDAWSAYRGWKEWPHVASTVIRNDAPRGSNSPHALLEYDVGGRAYTRRSSVSTSSTDFGVGARVEQAVDPSDASRGVTLRERNVDFQSLAGMLALSLLVGAFGVAALRTRARKPKQA